MTIKAKVVYNYGIDDVELYVIHTAFNGVRHYLPPAIFKELTQLEPAEPFLKYNTNGMPETTAILQAILNAAWEFGMRPTGFGDIKNETAAIKSHLDDMRRLVFSHINPYKITELK